MRFYSLSSDGGVCGRAVNTSNSGLGGPGFKPRPSRCFLRQGTLLHFVSLHPCVSLPASFPFARSCAARFARPNRRAYSQVTQLYKWVPSTYCWGQPCDGLASCPGSSSNTPRFASCSENRDKLRSFGPLARVSLPFLLPTL